VIEYYAEIRWVHIHAVIVSIVLFTLRGALMAFEVPWRQHLVLRSLPHAIDTILLTSALMLSTVLQQYPFAQPWLTVKVVALVVYIVLGSIALKRGRTKGIRLAAFFAALATVLFIVSVARLREPLGILSMIG
jgi:uncharacterized membrane protein SirB2